MNKKDIIPVIVIFALFLAYPTIDRKYISKIFPAKEKPEVVQTAESVDAPVIPTQTELTAVMADAPALPQAEVDAAEAAEAVAAPPAAAALLPEVLTTLQNDKLQLEFSSHGGGVISAAILDYPLAKGSDVPVTFDFAGRPAAAPSGELFGSTDFTLVTADERSITYRKTLTPSLAMSRSIHLGDAYQFRVEDRFENTGKEPLDLAGNGLQLGYMPNLPGEQDDRTPLLGVDSLTGDGSVQHWSGKFEKWFSSNDSRAQTHVLSGSRDNDPMPVDWLAVKNKYFTQILTPDTFAERADAIATRGAPVKRSSMLIFSSTVYPIEQVAAGLTFPEQVIGPGQTMEQSFTYYIGPKVYSELKANGPHQENILQLGMWRMIGILILRVMVWFHAHIWPYSYGLAIILLTFLIRIIFWPLNHKAMASTRRMQELQPLMTAMKEKYKDDPAKQQQAMMALYKEHKINPLGGCLPMLIQIPVFFALFVVLRGAIELRFSSFLWISDLSTPENLFADKLPFGLNILPIFMGVTMWIQQKMSPGGDPQQQRMMMMMPILFTFLFYTFPSGLSLYWSVNQVMMIVQQLIMKKFHPSPGLAQKPA